MSAIAFLTRERLDLDEPALEHLQRLVASWDPLADLCFADLLLFVALPDGDELRFVVAGQVRPTTSQTVHPSDLVGEIIEEVDRPLVARALRTGDIAEGEINTSAGERLRVLAIPVRHDGVVVGVCSRESPPAIARSPGQLEQTYVEVFRRFAGMIAGGRFPYPGEAPPGEGAPRVGDGAMLLDGEGRVVFASPNAISSLHRLAVVANPHGRDLSELGLVVAAVVTAYAEGRPETEELERRSGEGAEVSVLLRCMPLLDEGVVEGALVLLRDVSDLRSRDRLLVSLDQSIREIHHRVKNNLQTISSLLRLQGRRLQSPEAKAALEESVRRIRSMALVHETLSQAVGDDVDFTEIVRPLVRVVEEGLASPERPVQVVVTGEAGMLPAQIATPLAVVLTELLQNALDHAYPPEVFEAEPGRVGRVEVSLANDGVAVRVEVVDDGVGLPADFRLDSSASLGLTIVRSLVTSQIGGAITMRDRVGGGTEVELRVPVMR